jgi:tRNA (adenine22-N1)-methyltransferase
MAADMVRIGSRVADIGTDHAYLPASLILSGKIPSAIAADLRKGPLENAEETVIINHIEDKVQLRLSDGLKCVSPDEADDIVIAGMGGILISEILANAEWVKNPKYKLVLQPQSHDEDVRKYLFDNGFSITDERVCFEDGKVYICIGAVYTGKKSKHSEAELMFGSILGQGDEAAVAFKEKKLKRIKARLSALNEYGGDEDEKKLLKKIMNEIKS